MIKELYKIDIDKLSYSLENGNKIEVKDYIEEVIDYYKYKKYNNSLESFNHYLKVQSQESVIDKIKNIGKWLVELIKKIIHHLEVLAKMIIAKIYEYTARGQNDLYHKFEKALFDRVDLKIKDRKLNPNLVSNSIKFMVSLNQAIKSFSLFNDINEMEMNSLYNRIIDLKEQREKGEFLDYLFYAENKPREMTIGEYFGCKAREMPAHLTIIGPEYLKLLKENKKNVDLSIKQLKAILNKISKSSDEELKQNEKFKLIKNNVLILYNANYTFFIKSIKVRKKVTKYILKAAFNDLLRLVEDKDDLDDTNEVRNYRVPNFQKMDDVEIAIKQFYDFYDEKPIKAGDDGANLITLEITNPTENYINIHIKDKSDPYSSKYDSEIWNNLVETFNECIRRDSFDNVADIIETVFKLETKIPRKNLTYYIDIQDAKGLITIVIMYAFYKYQINRNDIVYYTDGDENIFSKTKSFIRGQTATFLQYSEPRFYGAINKMVQRNGHSSNSYNRLVKILNQFKSDNPKKKIQFDADFVKNFKVYIVDAPIGTTVYADPEFVRFHQELEKGVIFIPTNQNVRLINVTPYIREIQDIY